MRHTGRRMTDGRGSQTAGRGRGEGPGGGVGGIGRGGSVGGPAGGEVGADNEGAKALEGQLLEALGLEGGDGDHAPEDDEGAIRTAPEDRGSGVLVLRGPERDLELGRPAEGSAAAEGGRGHLVDAEGRPRLRVLQSHQLFPDLPRDQRHLPSPLAAQRVIQQRRCVRGALPAFGRLQSSGQVAGPRFRATPRRRQV